ncbi:hypothetical protein ACIGW3_24065 [Streptomyces sp. NPDC053499]|uniref:hypothetical protein n=1 Tax=Streptomyces sp. NPDC053499 TaxID=3365707 RepID=UPI0037D89ACC
MSAQVAEELALGHEVDIVFARGRPSAHIPKVFEVFREPLAYADEARHKVTAVTGD